MAFVHGRHVRTLVHDGDLSCYFNEATTSFEIEMAETTTFCDSARTYIPGVSDGTLSLTGLWDGAPGAVDEVLREHAYAGGPLERETVISVFPHNFLTVGRRASLFSALETSLEVSSSIGDVVSISADFQGSGPTTDGWLLAAHIERTADADEAAVDTGAAFDTPSTNGLVAHVHVTGNARTADTTVRVQSSADQAVWVDHAVFTVPARVTGPPVVDSYAQRIRAMGAVARYLRATATSTDAAAAITYAVTAARLNALS